jgi:hypothetical protein
MEGNMPFYYPGPSYIISVPIANSEKNKFLLHELKDEFEQESRLPISFGFGSKTHFKI